MEKFDRINEIVKKFRDDREWSQFHNPKDLAISLSIEAAELLECFQWKSSAEAEKNNYQDIKYEMADVAIYLLLMCDKIRGNKFVRCNRGKNETQRKEISCGKS